MAGHWARPDATTDVMRGLHSGDAGSMYENRFIYIKDRIKDMIPSASENTDTGGGGGGAGGHPDIVECAVIGVPDKKWGETVKAVVVKRARSTLTEKWLID